MLQGKYQFEKTEQASESDPFVPGMLELTDYDAKGLNGQRRQHARADGLCKQRDGHFKENIKKEMLKIKKKTV